jgi:hypothetical protein
MLDRVKKITDRISLNLLGMEFKLKVSLDEIYKNRVYLQIIYKSPCTESGKVEEWKGGKSYLSEFMTDDEIVKKAYVAFEQAVKHEVMESFKVDGITLFNPHINFEELLKVSHKEVKRN